MVDLQEYDGADADAGAGADADENKIDIDEGAANMNVNPTKKQLSSRPNTIFCFARFVIRIIKMANHLFCH